MITPQPSRNADDCGAPRATRTACVCLDRERDAGSCYAAMVAAPVQAHAVIAATARGMAKGVEARTPSTDAMAKSP